MLPAAEACRLFLLPFPVWERDVPVFLPGGTGVLIQRKWLIQTDFKCFFQRGKGHGDVRRSQSERS